MNKATSSKKEEKQSKPIVIWQDENRIHEEKAALKIIVDALNKVVDTAKKMERKQLDVLSQFNLFQLATQHDLVINAVEKDLVSGGEKISIGGLTFTPEQWIAKLGGGGSFIGKKAYMEAARYAKAAIENYGAAVDINSLTVVDGKVDDGRALSAIQRRSTIYAHTPEEIEAWKMMEQLSELINVFGRFTDKHFRSYRFIDHKGHLALENWLVRDRTSRKWKPNPAAFRRAKLRT